MPAAARGSQDGAAARVAVLGAGAWGTTLAILLARNRHSVCLWGHDAGHMAALDREHHNARYLPDVFFPETLEATADLDRAMTGARDLVIAVPSAAFRPLLQRLAGCLRPGTRLCWVTKGLDAHSGLLHHVVAEVLGAVETAVVSGPSFAAEVAAGLPTAVTVASSSPDYAMDLADRLHNARFRAYTSSDVIGVQLGGVIKNVLAIAAGIADGLGYGSNTRAALVTRGLAEMTRLGIAMGGQRDTFAGLAGLGDLVLSCTDNQSRNRRFGIYLGQGLRTEAALHRLGLLVEGLPAVRALRGLAQTAGTEMPISEQVYQVCYAGRPPLEAVDELLGRQLKPEDT